MKNKVNYGHVEQVINDYLADALDALCAEYGIEMIEWYYPFDADAETAFNDYVRAVVEGIESTLSWYEE